ncbi:MAG: VOC family protein [Acidimicrobiales bacterium]
MTAAYPRLRATAIDATHARSVAEFWRELLGYGYRRGDEPPPDGTADSRGEDWLVLVDQAGEPRLAVQQVGELPRSTWPDPTVSQQLHLDLTVASVVELERQRDRATALGGTILENRIDDPEEALIVFADPAGHPFCIFVEGSPSG